MGMTIDLAMNNLSGILTEATEDEDSVCYVTENDAETLQVAIKIMRKYQKIEQIVNNYISSGKPYISVIDEDIKEVLEDGSN